MEVGTTDQNGKPVAAELSIALVDRSLLRLFGDRLPTIDRFFYDQSRTSAFATQSSATFRYQPATVPVPEAVVEDAAQQAAQLADAAGRDTARRQAGNVAFYATNGQQAAPAPAAARHGRHGRGNGASAVPTHMALSTRSDSRAGATRSGVAAKESLELGAVSAFDSSDSEGVATDKRLGHIGATRGRLRATRRSLGKEVGVAAPRERERFVETAYWNPSVVTGADGKAVVSSAPRPRSPNTDSPPGACPAATRSSARPRPTSRCGRTSSST